MGDLQKLIVVRCGESIPEFINQHEPLTLLAWRQLEELKVKLLRECEGRSVVIWHSSERRAAETAGRLSDLSVSTQFREELRPLESEEDVEGRFNEIMSMYREEEREGGDAPAEVVVLITHGELTCFPDHFLKHFSVRPLLTGVLEPGDAYVLDLEGGRPVLRHYHYEFI